MTKKMNVLTDFYEMNRIVPKGRVYKRHDQLMDGMYNKLQRMAAVHGMDLHSAVPSWTEVWIHVKDDEGNMVTAYKDKNHTAVRAELPPIAIQWKQDYSNRHKGNKNG